MDTTEDYTPPGPSGEPDGLFAGRYRIVGLLGRGRSGAVYRAIDTAALDSPIALKVFAQHEAASASDRARFDAEASILHDLCHSRIVRIFGHGVADDIPYISMELIDGVSLERWFAEQDPTPPRAFTLLRQLAEAISVLHRAGVVHRDLKPSNVLVMPNDQLKLVDFGVATGDGVRPGYTATGELVGTPAYMAPEQLAGAPASCRSDVYAFGLIGAELFGIELPPAALTPARREHDRCALVRKIGRSRRIPARLKAALLRCLHPSPAQRPANGTELGELLSDSRAAGTDHFASIVRKGSLALLVAGGFSVALLSTALTGPWARVPVGGALLRVLSMTGMIGLRTNLLPHLLGRTMDQLLVELLAAGDLEAARLLLSDFESESEFQLPAECPALQDAVIRGDAEAVKLVAPYSRDQLEEPTFRILSFAIQNEQWHTIPPLLDTGMNTTSMPGSLFTPLVSACQTDVLMRIVDAGFDPLQQLDIQGVPYRPTFDIGGSGCPPLVERFLERFSWDRWPADEIGITGIALAIARPDADLIPLLRRHGVDLATPSSQRGPLLFHAFGLPNGDERFARTFRAFSADERARLLTYRSALALAIGVENVETARLLSEAGAPLDIKITEAIDYAGTVEKRRDAVDPRIRVSRWGNDALAPESLAKSSRDSGAIIEMLLERKEASLLTWNELARAFLIAESNSCAPCMEAYLRSRRLGGLFGSIDALLVITSTARSLESNRGPGLNGY